MMLHNKYEKEKLFAKSVPVTVKDGYANQCRNTKLCLTVEWEESSAAIHRQELLISLTDNNDPFFLYNLCLTEEDFQALKSSQGLLVDFSAFPQKFIDLIEVCLVEENKSQPKFLLVFTVSGNSSSSSQLDVVETNPFKHLTHLSLKFVLATESTVKQYLSCCFRDLKEEKHQLQSRLTFLEQDFREKLSACQASLERKTQELETALKEKNMELSVRDSRHARELHEEMEKLLTQHREEKMRSERERNEKEEKLQKEIQHLESSKSVVELLNKNLQDKNDKQESTIKQLRSSLFSLEDEAKRNKESLRNLQSELSELSRQNSLKCSEVSRQKNEIADMKQKLSRKSEELTDLREQHDRHQGKAKSLQQKVEDLESRCRKLQNTCDALEEDVCKGNEVIRKMHDNIVDCSEKLRQKKIQISKQELILSDKDKTVDMLQEDLNNTKVDLRRKNNEVKVLSDSATALQDKIKNLEKELKARDRVIDFLNRKWTDQYLMPPSAPPSTLTTSPSIGLQNVLGNINAGGEPGTMNPHPSSTTLNSDKSKLTQPTRNGAVHSLQKETEAPPGGLHGSRALADSALSPPPHTENGNTRDQNANGQHFELDSAALNAAFGSGQEWKQSTAKKKISFKPTQERTKNLATRKK